MDDLAPRIKELRASQHELQQQRDILVSRIQSDTPEQLDQNEVMSYVNELEQILGEKSFLQQKTFLRRFVKRLEINPEGFFMDYTIPVPLDNSRTSREKFYILTKMVAGVGFEPTAFGSRVWQPDGCHAAPAERRYNEAKI